MKKTNFIKKRAVNSRSIFRLRKCILCFHFQKTIKTKETLKFIINKEDFREISDT